ncbi:VOC family protein [Novosphingobium pentaromativorans]|uniref:VOC domain-containing protein n=1 Tax=Novosphingobium pentaromativorans US6-1 TaxID=1088721 RepID=G6EGQ5_9SPHN|nr:VOC family protein [Novosphingobium pentaromativorans]AIT82092.1 hypothetical protein JI59_21390 [Novosphingobium pentaromativorans US6-1]EHJ59498.1 hypothetical protein NSU_3526 [Novosphingobium pentaromativorans US6-1]
MQAEAIKSVSSRLAELGDIMQIAFVLKEEDLHPAIDFWVRMGAGPFFWNERTADITYRGQPSRPHFTAVMGYWGKVQVELIGQFNDAPSIYKDWLDAGRKDMNHICIVVQDMAEARRRIAAVGGEIVQENVLPGGEVIYVSMGEGPYIEVAQVPDYAKSFSDMMEQAARDWDGVTEPLRAGGIVTS